jgi:probable phosphoglycerate mutase
MERLEARVADERILCVSHWGFIHYFTGRALFREAFSPAHLPALYRMGHINTGITLFQQRRDYFIEGERYDGWALLTWNDQAHL